MQFYPRNAITEEPAAFSGRGLEMLLNDAEKNDLSSSFMVS